MSAAVLNTCLRERVAQCHHAARLLADCQPRNRCTPPGSVHHAVPVVSRESRRAQLQVGHHPPDGLLAVSAAVARPHEDTLPWRVIGRGVLYNRSSSRRPASGSRRAGGEGRGAERVGGGSGSGAGGEREGWRGGQTTGPPRSAVGSHRRAARRGRRGTSPDGGAGRPTSRGRLRGWIDAGGGGSGVGGSGREGCSDIERGSRAVGGRTSANRRHRRRVRAASR